MESEPYIEEGGRESEVALPKEQVHLRADPHRLAQVLSNLLNNAAKYMRTPGSIRLVATKEGRSGFDHLDST